MEENNIVEVTRDEDIEVLDEPAEDKKLSFGESGKGIAKGMLLAGVLYGIVKGVIWANGKRKERRAKKTENNSTVSEPTADTDKK